VGEAVRTALELGYRHIDCASIYGNEAEIGQALASAFRDGVVQRDQLWITSKLWNDCHAPEQVRPALLRSLRDLGLEQLDLYLIHWPVVHRHGVLMPERASEQIPLEQMPLQDTWRAMEAAGSRDRRLQFQRHQDRFPVAARQATSHRQSGGTPSLAAAERLAGLLPTPGDSADGLFAPGLKLQQRPAIAAG
jgi:hypothetical protein